MHILELIRHSPFVWGLFALYLVATSWLAWRGHTQTKDIRSFAVGSGSMHPVVVGITLAASVTSTATFLINPGFVYIHGISALMHFGVAAGLGIFVGLFALSFRFRRIGEQVKAVTLPQWIGQRYESRAMTIFFAAANLMLITFMVLIVGSIAIAMQKTMGLSNIESLVLIIGFVFSYIFVGGTYAHAYTNTLQGGIMVVIAAVIVISGLHLVFEGDVIATLSAIDPNLATVVNPKSVLFSSPFSVWVCGFLIGCAVICQPHILNKALYVDSDRDVMIYLIVCGVVSMVFTSLLLVGLYVHLGAVPIESFTDPVTGKVIQDEIVVGYIRHTFSSPMVAVIIVALMAAGMSTLDGILIALSSIAANDLFLNLTPHNLLADKTEEEQLRAAHRAGQVILIVIGVALFVIMLDPPKLLGIFGQLGVYGVVAASIAPITCGVFFVRMPKVPVFIAAVLAVVVHVTLYIWGAWAMRSGVDLVQVVSDWGPLALLFDRDSFQLGFANPAVTATYGILASFVVALPAALIAGRAPRD